SFYDVGGGDQNNSYIATYNPSYTALIYAVPTDWAHHFKRGFTTFLLIGDSAHATTYIYTLFLDKPSLKIGTIAGQTSSAIRVENEAFNPIFTVNLAGNTYIAGTLEVIGNGQ